ncbi:hypothetical protein EST92_19800 [Streptomyces sp. TM32]|uniref:hypothetical protein n=1 Tax=Streptomyces sp. TM32 TaxID=1652669 RepID=UPI00101216BA|nr:hypothetical protein [Streptomyces sp. TM32]RXS78879.1 hypothetical protein EST92_19800 [Streptomyces sp. TM32]
MNTMTREELVALLDDFRDRVAAGDSLEGKLQYSLPPVGQHYEVGALYRIGQLLGQGSTTIVGITLDVPGAAA